MAEIKSTLEMVLERAAAMGAEDRQNIAAAEAVKQGMRLAADYLAGRLADFAAAMAEQPLARQVHLRRGIGQTLLRNIVLPRDDRQLAMAENAMQGLLNLAAGGGELPTLISEIKQLLEHFRQHRQQLRQQLETAITQQLAQVYAQQPGKEGLTGRIDPTLHPKFQEEWQRLQADLNSQYGQALDQHKAVLLQRLAPVA